jgi:hypothetical protein
VALQAAIDLARELYPDAVLRSISGVYNCGGMVVACRRVSVDPADAVSALRADGYRELHGPHEVELGDVVVYHDDNNNPVHLGVVMSKPTLQVAGGAAPPIEVLSKWGADGEYLHEMRYVPVYLGHPAQFWTDRRLP